MNVMRWNESRDLGWKIKRVLCLTLRLPALSARRISRHCTWDMIAWIIKSGCGEMSRWDVWTDVDWWILVHGFGYMYVIGQVNNSGKGQMHPCILSYKPSGTAWLLILVPKEIRCQTRNVTGTDIVVMGTLESDVQDCQEAEVVSLIVS